ncbi:hypothetical protein DERF_006960 [Dermatophagoides farinae]|uniref:Uncharacterized protein n=1 Tax=Dermatophagoides farinae TaxID=6954 RepID=A0A922L413_DERFA|nr:hypothetical protein DERF_006960 [Dermatophagoides farinae]
MNPIWITFSYISYDYISEQHSILVVDINHYTNKCNIHISSVSHHIYEFDLLKTCIQILLTTDCLNPYGVNTYKLTNVKLFEISNNDDVDDVSSGQLSEHVLSYI